ncbi:MAG: type II secretion system F family protein [Sneathiella sp.]
MDIFSWILPKRKFLIGEIAQAGFTGLSAEPLFYFYTLSAGSIGGVLGLNMSFGLSLFFVGFWAAIFDTLFLTMVFSMLPFMVLRILVRKRREELELHVPDVIDLLVLCVGTGLTLEASLRKTTEAIANLSPMLSSEMKTMLNELRILPDKSSAFENLQNRTSSEGLRYLFAALNQSEIYGTSITASLRSVAIDNRKRKMIELENTSARLPVLLSLPLILFILPPVIAISAGPGFVLMLRSIGG